MKLISILVQYAVQKSLHKKKEDDPHYDTFKIFFDDLDQTKKEQFFSYLKRIFDKIKPQALDQEQEQLFNDIAKFMSYAE